MTTRPVIAIGLFCGMVLASGARAATLIVQVKDHGDTAVKNAVVRAEPLSASASVSPDSTGVTLIDQRGRQFLPWVVGIRTGEAVTFANHDDITHHVYSFSEAKQFSFRLRADATRAPLRFDTPGVVVIGCNIHDWMVGYIFVTDQPHVAVTDDSGAATFDSMSPGDWRIVAWHPGIAENAAPPASAVTVPADGEKGVTLRFQQELSVKKAPEPLDDTNY